MRRLMRWTKHDALIPLLAVLALALCGPVLAADAGQALSLKGDFVQGGLVTGHTDPRARVTLDGTPVPVRADGRFLIGFGRDAGKTARLLVTLPDGAAMTREIAVAPRDFPTQRIDGLPEKMVTPPAAVIARIRADAKDIRDARLTDTPRPMFDAGFVWPVQGPVTGVYGSQRILNGKPRRPHYGIDIAAPAGTRVAAATDGIVRVAARDMYFTGGTVLIDHGFGLNSVYSHLAGVTVRPGQAVKKGEIIGTVGSTGRSTGAHLDWRVNLFLTRLDPALLVPPMPEPVTPAGD